VHLSRARQHHVLGIGLYADDGAAFRIERGAVVAVQHRFGRHGVNALGQPGWFRR
jgi:hypothetical protein